jgi:HNH endonuclease
MAQRKHALLGNREWLKGRIDAGRSWKEIAQDAGLTSSTISLVAYYVRKHGLQGTTILRKGKSPHPLLNDRDWMKTRIDAGKTQSEIACEAGLPSTHSSLVAYYAKKHGFTNQHTERSERSRAAMAKKYPNGRYGELAGNWRGGRSKHGGGYIKIMKPDHPYADGNGYVLEHRYVMEQKIGRILRPEQVVDHIDRNRSNNHPDNLALHETRAQHVKDHFSARDQLVIVQGQLVSALEKIARYEKLYGPLPEADV